MLSRSDELRFYEAEKRILRQFEDDRDVQDYLQYLEDQDEELFIRVSDLKIEIQELEDELGEVAEERNELELEVNDLDFEMMELKILNNQLKKASSEAVKELEDVEEELSELTEDFNIQLRLNTHLLNENSVLKADLERLRRED